MNRRLYLHDRHAASGAGFLSRRGWTLPAHYGGGTEGEALAREYVAARERCAVADLSDRAVLAVTGPTRQKFLHSILSNEVAGLKPGQGRRAALMDPKGHQLVWMRVLVAEDSVLLETNADRLELLEQRLQHYRVAAPVRLAARPDVVLGLLGPRATALLRENGCEAPGDEPESHVLGTISGTPLRVVRAGDLPCHGLALHVSREGAATVWTALCAVGARPLGRRALDALRVEEGQPWYGEDVTEENLLHETGLVAAYHSPTKGCYVGQEVIARLTARGANVNKRLRGLRMTAPVEEGSPVEADGKPVGHVTTMALSPRLGAVALAYLHRSVAEPETRLLAAGTEAVVCGLPFAGVPGQ